MNSIDIFPWNENFNTGLAIIDDQHKMLIKLLNMLASHIAFKSELPEINRIFDELADYAIYHFETEEKIWHQYLNNDSLEGNHKASHQSFIDTVLQLRIDKNAKPLILLIEELLAFLTRWLATHILENDRYLAKVVLAIESGMTIVEAKEYATAQLGGSTKVLIDIILSIYDTLSSNTLHLMRELAEHKRDEDALRKLSLAVEQSPNSIIITDLDANIEYVNQTFTLITGYQREEVLGKNPKIMQSGKTLESVYEDLWSTLKRGEIWKGELINRRKDGREYIEAAIISPVRQADGNITHFLAIKEDITEQKRTHNLLHDSERRFEIVANAAPVLIWMTDFENRYTWFNQVWLNFTNRTMDAEVNDGWMQGLHPDDLQRYRAISTDHIKQHEPFRLEYRLKRFDGQYRWLHDHAVPRFDAQGTFEGYIGSCVDMTDQIVAREEANNAKQALENVLSAATEISIIATTPDGLITTFNRGAELMLGYRAEELIGKQPASICHLPEEIDARGQELTKELGYPISGFQIFIAKASLQGQETREWTYVRKDGSTLPVSLVVTTIRNPQGEISGFLDIAENIIERKQTVLAIQQAKERAEALAKSKSEFLANMSHEIRTPMNAIIGLTHLSLNKQPPPDIRDYLEKISHSSNSLLSILNDILDFSRIESGRMSIEQSPFDLDTLLKNIENLFAHRAEEKFLEFELSADQDVPRQLIGDALRIQQILINLVGNAIKFTEHGKVSLCISLIATENVKVQLLFCINDTGIGMSDKDREKLFQPFSQIDGSINRRFGGTGLGLVISQNLLQLMGGEFSVASTPGKGSKFCFKLTLEKSLLSREMPSEHEPKALSTTVNQYRDMLFGKRVLVAEDNVINQQVVKELLILSGLDVTTVLNGQEALNALTHERFDAVLMDIHMPEMDGFEATKQIRKLPGMTSFQIIALTAGVTEEERQKCLEVGMNDFVAKPINPKQLLSTLAHSIAPHQAFEQITHHESTYESLSSSDNELIIDMNYLTAMFNHKQSTTDRILSSFRYDMNEFLDKLDAALSADDLVLAQELIHMIKGTAGNIGARALETAARTLEQEFKKGAPQATTLANFQQTFKHTLNFIANLMPSEPVEININDNTQALIPYITELDQLLKENDFVSEEMLNTLKCHLSANQLNLFHILRTLIGELQYNEARKLLQLLVEPSKNQASE